MPVLGATRAQLKTAERKPVPLPKPPGAGVTGGVQAGSRSQGVGKIVNAPKAFQGNLPKAQVQALRSSRQQAISKGEATLPRPGASKIPLGTITLNPFHDISTVTQASKEGWESIGKAVGGGAAKEAGKLIGNTVAGAINLPAQALPTVYHATGAAAEAVEGKPRALKQMGREYLESSAPAHLIKGEFHKALESAEANPPMAALEVAGGLSAADRLAGGAERLAGAGELADPRAAETGLSRQPQSLMAGEGKASEPLHPYDKGLLRKGLEAKRDPDERPEGFKLSQKLRQHYDRTEGSLLRINRNHRSDIADARMKAVHTGTLRPKPIPGIDAVSHFARGVLSDPKVLSEHGEPVYRDQLSKLVEDHTARMTDPNSRLTPVQKQLLEVNRNHAQRLLEDRSFQRDPNQAYEAAQKLAADKARLEPDLQKAGIYTAKQMRTAKAIPAFQFHWSDQEPWVDTNPTHDTFTISDGKGGRTVLPIDQVYKELERKGVHEKQLGFISTKPFENPNAAFNSSPADIRSVGRPEKGGLTGAAFRNGQYDATYDAAIRQHLHDQKLVDESKAAKYKTEQYVYTRADMAKLIEERKSTLPADQQPDADRLIQELRAPGSRWLSPQDHVVKAPDGTETTRTESPWEQAQRHAQAIEALHPKVKLEPIRVAHQLASQEYRDALAKTGKPPAGMPAPEDSLEQILDPATSLRPGALSQFPTDPIDQNNVHAGEVGLVHKEIADRMRAYKNVNASPLASMASVWRRANVAYSVRHVPGVMQEIGIRALMNKIGIKSLLRGRKIYDMAMKAADDPAYAAANPDAAQYADQLRAMSGGTVAQMTQDLSRHVTDNRLWGTRTGAVIGRLKDLEAKRITGAPLRAARDFGNAYGKVTNGILSIQRKLLERPQEISGLGKFQNDEFKRITGKSLPVLKAMDGVYSDFAKGILDQKRLDAAASAMREYWGDWSSMSPKTKAAMTISPFFKWYVNSLKFIYHTMPLHHPVKTGLLATLEDATKGVREAEGQGYEASRSFPFLPKLGPEKLAEGQQGSLPGGEGFRVGSEYYTPAGAVSGGLETATGSLFPWVSDSWAILHGTNPVSGRTLENGEKEQITDANARGLMAMESALEGFVPPYRMLKTGLEKGSSEKEDALGKALGISPSLWKVFRPLRTEQERTQSGEIKYPTGKAAGGVSLPSINVPSVNLPSINISG
jgi:hypothetical protein